MRGKQKAENSVKRNKNVNMLYGKKRRKLNTGGDKMVDEQWIYCPNEVNISKGKYIIGIQKH